MSKNRFENNRIIDKSDQVLADEVKAAVAKLNEVVQAANVQELKIWLDWKGDHYEVLIQKNL